MRDLPARPCVGLPAPGGALGNGGGGGMKRLGLVVLVVGILPACTGAKATGPTYVDLMIDAMATETRVAGPTDNPEQAVQAVRAWRSAEDAPQGPAQAVAPQSGR